MSHIAEFNEPFTIFTQLLGEARAIDRDRLPEPTSFALATVGDDGRPSVRIVLLKGFDERGFVFYTNYESRKGRELLAHPHAAMCFHWQPMERQVRVEGSVSTVSESEADAYFVSRPRGSQLGAWASQQSRPIEHMGDLEKRFADVESRFNGRDVERPPHWSGFRIDPQRIEFWHGKPSRLHERHVFTRADRRWNVEILYP